MVYTIRGVRYIPTGDYARCLWEVWNWHTPVCYRHTPVCYRHNSCNHRHNSKCTTGTITTETRLPGLTAYNIFVKNNLKATEVFLDKQETTLEVCVITEFNVSMETLPSIDTVIKVTA
ncbi:hypothetical protein EZS27_022733 [termite gut metagenome]|uniref:Uncharacterized protein n=1 Tax=termite gut metagenome TaxID=433724 RepID=A0A5J4R4Z7_9ZZZZ